MDRLPITPDKQPIKAEGVAPSTLKVRPYPARPPAIEAIAALAKTIPGMSKDGNLTLGTFRLWLAEGDMCEIACTEGARRVCGVGPSNASGSDLSSATRAEPLAPPDFPQVDRAIASPRGG